MLTCNVTFHCKSGCRSQFYQEITAIKLQEYSSQEAGNIKYEFYFSATDSDTLLLVETWIDEAFQKQHSMSEAVANLQPLKSLYCTGLTVDRCIS